MSVCSVQPPDETTDSGVKPKRKHGPIDHVLREKVRSLEGFGDCFTHPLTPEQQAAAEGLRSYVLYNKPHSYARKLQMKVVVRIVKAAGLMVVVRVK